MSQGRRGWAAVAGAGVGRAWLLDLELGWYAVVLVVILVGHAAGSSPGHPTEFVVMTGLSVLCALAALVRWWIPAWAGPAAVAVIALGIVVLLVRPLGPLGPLRLMLSSAVTPVLLVAATRRAPAWNAALAVALAAVAVVIDIDKIGNTLSVVLSRILFARTPTLPVVVLTAILVVVMPVALGLLLRASDGTRRAALLAGVRAEERRQVARELHDMVANHVTGIIVTAQAAGLSADVTPATNHALDTIEASGNRALTAMQRMVTVLRSTDVIDLAPEVGHAPGELPAAAGTPLAAVRAAVGDDPRVRIRAAGAPDREVAADVVTTLHRVVVEALTNARRHTPPGSGIDVELSAPQAGVVAVEITNVRAPATARARGGGFGLLGLRERVDAVGGHLDAGPTADQRWRLRAELPA